MCNRTYKPQGKEALRRKTIARAKGRSESVDADDVGAHDGDEHPLSMPQESDKIPATGCVCVGV
jgi:hypothetical protein